MGIIFYMSSQHRIGMTASPAGDFVAFKSLHMVEYALLFFLLYRALNSLHMLNERVIFFSTLFLSTIYSSTDELHQLFIATRSGKIRDVFIDVLGMIIMYTVIRTVRFVHMFL